MFQRKNNKEEDRARERERERERRNICIQEYNIKNGIEWKRNARQLVHRYEGNWRVFEALIRSGCHGNVRQSRWCFLFLLTTPESLYIFKLIYFFFILKYFSSAFSPPPLCFFVLYFIYFFYYHYVIFFYGEGGGCCCFGFWKKRAADVSFVPFSNRFYFDRPICIGLNDSNRWKTSRFNGLGPFITLDFGFNVNWYRWRQLVIANEISW